MAGNVSDSEAAKLVPNAVEVLPAGKLCPASCGQHCRGLFCSFTLLIVLGSALVPFLHELAATVLTLGPTVIIIVHFYRRYERSTSISQVAFTFCEAILWMVPLCFFIGFVDRLNTHLTGLPMELECSWSPDGGGKALVQALSFSAHCKASLFDIAPSGDWDGLECSPALVNVSLPHVGNVSIPSPLRHDGSVPLRLMEGILNVSAQGVKGDASCPSLEHAVDEALDSVSVRSVAQGDRIVHTTSRRKVAEAFDELFSRVTRGSLEVPDGCQCSKSVYMDAAVKYDYCSPSGKCKVARSWECESFSSDECAPASEENVTVTFRLIRSTVLNSFTTAYFRAALLEESLKYVTVRRILFKDRVADCSGLLLYALAAAAGFATAENVQYTLANGIFVTYARMVLSVPFHCCTGLIIGIHLGYRKFLGWGYACPVTLLVPVLLHGTYDFVLMLPDDQGPSMVVRTLAVLAIMVGGFLYCRYAWLRLENVCVVDVKTLQAEGRVSKSQCCCCERDCCRPLCEFEDPMLKGATGPSISEAAVQTEDDDNNRIYSNNAWRRSHSSLSDLGVSATKELWPEQPTCQTTLAECPQCGNDVRLHIFFPCTCPFCSHAFHSPAAQPAPTPVVPPMKQESGTTSMVGLANRVVILGFTSLLLHLATSVVMASTAYPEVGKLPQTHVSFEVDCASGKLRHSFCRTVQYEFTRWCKEEKEELAVCKEHWGEHLRILKEDVAISMEIDIWFSFCCVMSISLCGCIGACRNSRPWVTCFWVFSILDVVWHAVKLLSGDLFPLLTLAFPVAGWYYGHKLRQAQADSAAPPAPP